MIGIFRFANIAFAAFLLGACPAFAETSATVEEGMDLLASQIVERGPATPTTVAVLPFNNSDGTCSVLGTYLVDELTFRLFSTEGSTLEVIERSRIEALLAEMKIGSSGLLDPSTSMSFGSLSGVSAFALGTITAMEDTVRLNVRLVGTESGKTLSVAAVSIPRTAAIDNLITAPAYCDEQTQQTAGSSKAPKRRLPGAQKDGLQVEIDRVTFAENSDSSINLILRVTNKSRDTRYIAHGASSFVLSNGTICDRGSMRTDVDGLGWGDDDLSPIVSGEVIQYSVKRIGCTSEQFSNSGALNLVMLSGIEGRSPKETRFQVFDIEFAGQ